ncbi:MAG: hypothetical protein ABI977_25755 [Acidobacteriota bacterium]
MLGEFLPQRFSLAVILEWHEVGKILLGDFQWRQFSLFCFGYFSTQPFVQAVEPLHFGLSKDAKRFVKPFLPSQEFLPQELRIGSDIRSKFIAAQRTHLQRGLQIGEA